MRTAFLALFLTACATVPSKPDVPPPDLEVSEYAVHDPSFDRPGNPNFNPDREITKQVRLKNNTAKPIRVRLDCGFVHEITVKPFSKTYAIAYSSGAEKYEDTCKVDVLRSN